MTVLDLPEIARRVAALRERRGMAPDELAACAGIEPTLLTAFESGEATLPTQALVAVAGVFDMQTEDLLSDERTSTEPLFRHSVGDDDGAEATRRADRVIGDFFALEALTRR